jgi:uncharacterized repeat protein (TIGR01451 family)/LPXTG-motif cell wall-anchored protein
MNKITKAGVGVAAIATVAAGALVISAWGPDRPTYTMNDPADHVTFNSITDNSMLMGGYTMNGDERYFVEASPFTGDASTLNWADDTAVENGKEYVVHMYVHNDAASNLNLEAENVRAHVLLPTDAASSIELTGMISSSNATPNNVYDVTTFVSADGRDFTLDYVAGSAKFTNCDESSRNEADKACTASRSFELGDELFTEGGALLGYNQMDGKIPGCIAYAGWVSFHVKANFHEAPNYEVSKDAKIKGSDQEWSKEVTGAKDGDTIVYRLHFSNTGNTTLYDVNLRDLLPINTLNFMNGTTYLVNSVHPDGYLIEDTIATEQGLYIGDYAPGADAYVFFETTIKEGVDDECHNTQIHNVIQANASTTPDGNSRSESKEDTADVYVDGQICEEDHPGFTIDKMVQIKGTDSWSENVTVKANDTVRYRIQFKNTGDTTLENVVISDKLPAGLNYVKGSTVLYNAENTDGKTMGDEVVNGGLNIGSVAAGSEATIYFYATADSSFADDCQSSKLTNIARGKYNNDDNTSKEDTADVTVEGMICDVPEYPNTGAESNLGAIVATAMLASAAAGYIVSRKK